jgi:two-component system, chemotaxis family, chemotaxis protein CheY
MKILIVDDAGVMRKVITRELIDMGIAQADVDEAANGKEAVDKATAAAAVKPYDLILMDWNMPEMLGIDAVVAIRAAKIASPIMMVTTEAERANIVKAIQCGANNYLTKPFNKEDFKAKVVQTIGPGPYLSEADQKAVAAQGATA